MQEKSHVVQPWLCVHMVVASRSGHHVWFTNAVFLVSLGILISGVGAMSSGLDGDLAAQLRDQVYMGKT